MVDEMYPEAEKIILVIDNLNTHKPSSLYKAFKPEEARRIIKKLEINYTPKHGSWLDIAEIDDDQTVSFSKNPGY
ncbi:transposase [Lactobacillus delbrueckii subsp. bulgaricus]